MRYLELAHWNFKQLLIAVDQVIRVLIAFLLSVFGARCKGYADETMSAWCYRQNKLWYGKTAEIIVNCLMFIPELIFYRLGWGHCKRAYKSELYRTHSPV